jgi:hypothetical protein
MLHQDRRSSSLCYYKLDKDEKSATPSQSGPTEDEKKETLLLYSTLP